MSLLALPLLGGCAAPDPMPPPLVAPYPNPRSLVVVPLMNHSPSGDFDTISASDILVAELAQVKGLNVLPTNRPLKILAARGQTHVTSVEQARELAQLLGADGVVVGAITDYQPYPPQRVGMILQLYWLRADTDPVAADPAQLARQPREVVPAYYSGTAPVAQAQGTLDASRNEVTERARLYAAGHQGQDSPYGWRRYLVDSDAYMHFVCHEMIVQLMEQELARITVPVQ